MTMIPVILSSELLPKMRHGFTTLTQSQKCRAWLTPPTKFKRAHLAGKVMTSIFWDSQGVIIIDYLEQVRTINSIMKATCGGFTRKSQERGEENWLEVFCSCRTTPLPKTSQFVMTAATECGYEILPHPPYSPDMAPSDFYLFPKLKSHLRGTQYGSNVGVMEAVFEYLGDQEKDFYFEGIRKPEQRWA